MPGSLIHHLPPLVVGKDGGEQLVLPVEEASRFPTPPFSSQICCSSPHTAPVTLAPALYPYTVYGTRLTASSRSNQDLLDCSSLHHSFLWGRRVPAAPSMSPGMSPPSPSAETPWYSWRPNTCSLQGSCSLLYPPLRLLSHWQGWKEDAPSAKGTPGWTGTPCSFSQAVTSSTGPHCTQDWSVRDLSLHLLQVCTAFSCEERPDSMWCTTQLRGTEHCSTAWLPQVTFSINPRTAEL